MGTISDLQRVIVARIEAAVPSLADSIYDRKVPEGAALPYASIGPAYGHDDSAECIDGQSVTVQIDIFASSYPDSQVASDTTAAVRRALNGWADTEVLTMSPMHVSLWQVIDDPDPAKLHGFVQVEVSVED